MGVCKINYYYMNKLFKKVFKPKTECIKPMDVVQVGKAISFNEMGEKQNPALYIHIGKEV